MEESAASAAKPRRVAQAVRLRHEKRDEYLRLHAAVWPEVEAVITTANIRNYSIYLLGDVLFSYYEYVGVDYTADMRELAADRATQRWWKLTDPCQERFPGAPEGKQWSDLPEVWHMD